MVVFEIQGPQRASLDRRRRKSPSLPMKNLLGASVMEYCQTPTPRDFGILDRRIGFDLPSSSMKSIISSS